MAIHRTYQIGEVADISAVSVRTLRYYDSIQLLVPKIRTDSGYRVYDDQDLLRLQQILAYRALGFSLKEIGDILDAPGFNHRRALLEQRELLRCQVRQGERMLASIDNALAMIDADERKTAMGGIFDGFEVETYEKDAEARWGEGDAYKESARRTASYGEIEWSQVKREQEDIFEALAAAMKLNRAPDGDQVQAIVEKHRLYIDRWFYPCSRKMHLQLASMYEGDNRFAQTMDQFGVGLTAYFVRAIRAG